MVDAKFNQAMNEVTSFCDAMLTPVSAQAVVIPVETEVFRATGYVGDDGRIYDDARATCATWAITFTGGPIGVLHDLAEENAEVEVIIRRKAVTL